MNEGWIKLYRKSKDNPLMRDPTAWMIFCWIMLSVDRTTAEMTIGRFWASEYFEINPSTFRDAIYRLRDKYKVIDTHSDNRKTTVRVLNWSKYQSIDDPTTPTATTGRQLDDNKTTHIQEYKNKELRNIPSGSKNPCPIKDHLLCKSFLDKLAKMKNLPNGWLNYPKQLSFLHKLLKSGYTFDQIEREAVILDKSNFMWDKWDLSTLISQIEKKGREVYVQNK